MPHATGLILIDTGTPGTVGLIGEGLDRLGATWSDVTDIVVTHQHFDHVASLADAVALAGAPAVWAGAEDRAGIPFDGTIGPLDDGGRVHDLRIVATPGHTPGHRSLAHDDAGLLFVGDALGTMDGVLTRGPAQFTSDPEEAERSLRRLATPDWRRMVFSHGAEIADPLAALRQLVAGDDAIPT